MCNTLTCEEEWKLERVMLPERALTFSDRGCVSLIGRGKENVE
jgi:hypothetical protein